MKIFLFYFEMAIKITGSAQNYRVGRVSGNTPIFFRPNHYSMHVTYIYLPSQMDTLKALGEVDFTKYALLPIIQYVKWSKLAKLKML